MKSRPCRRQRPFVQPQRPRPGHHAALHGSTGTHGEAPSRAVPLAAPPLENPGAANSDDRGVKKSVEMGLGFGAELFSDACRTDTNSRRQRSFRNALGRTVLPLCEFGNTVG